MKMNYIGKGKLEIKGNEIILEKEILIRLYKADAIESGLVIVIVKDNEITVLVEPLEE